MTEGKMVNVELKSVSDGNRREDDPTMKENIRGLYPLIGIAEVLGILPCILLIYWCLAYGGGLGLGEKNVFNWHPVLVTISFVYMTGNGILTFRMIREKPKKTSKLIHSCINGISSVLGLMGVWAAFQHHINQNIPTLYTIHSWIGCMALIVYLAQVIVGITAFLYPGYSPTTRAMLMPYHRFIGQALLAVSVVAVVSGINEKAIWQLKKAYSGRDIQGILFNCVGLFVTLYCTIVIYISSNVDYKRYPRAIDGGSLDRTR